MEPGKREQSYIYIMSEEMEHLIWDWIDDYMDTDGYKLYRGQFVETCLSDLVKTFQSIYAQEIGISEEEIEDLVAEVWSQYSKLYKIPKLCYSSFMFSIKRYMNEAGYSTTDAYKLAIRNELEALANLPQPEQRTPEWYEMRGNLLTATAISKLFFSEARTNSVIYEKCSGNGSTKPFHISTTDPRHWGQKYEPVTREIYELIYHTKIQEYGCIRHRKYPFIGASPDGINVYPHSSKFGRLIEIKNIFNREIICEPSEEYWIQMQIQMEVCDLDICDFVETRFKELTETEYYDKIVEPMEITGEIEEESEKSVEFHGIMLQFMNRKDVNDIHYEYMPLFHTGVIPCKEKVDKWQESVVEKLYDDYVFIKTLFWYLDEMSVVVVLRNHFWFDKALPEIRRVWSLVEKERISGFDHRKPKSGVRVYKIDDIELGET